MAGFKIDDCTSRRAPGRLIRRIDKLAQGLIDERLAPIGLGYAAWATLKLVREGVVGTASELGRELGYTSGATTRLVDGLEQRGFIMRDRDRLDRRVVSLGITDAGLAIADRGMPVAVGVWNEIVADLAQDEADRLVDTLRKLLTAAEAIVGERDLRAVEPAE